MDLNILQLWNKLLQKETMRKKEYTHPSIEQVEFGDICIENVRGESDIDESQSSHEGGDDEGIFIDPPQL